MPEMRASASAPAKVILFGEHAVNRGQMGIAAGVGLFARCSLTLEGETFRFHGAGQQQETRRADLLTLRREVDAWRETSNFEAIRSLARADFFAPQKYIIAHAGKYLSSTMRKPV